MAPVLYAEKLHPDQLNPLIESKFKGKGGVELANVGLSSSAERGKGEEGEGGGETATRRQWRSLATTKYGL